MKTDNSNTANSKKTERENVPSLGKTRAKVQEILAKNMKYPTGNFHTKELNETSFLKDLFSNFDLTPKK